MIRPTGAKTPNHTAVEQAHTIDLSMDVPGYLRANPLEQARDEGLRLGQDTRPCDQRRALLPRRKTNERRDDETGKDERAAGLNPFLA
jgi:hypothetical protein